MQPVQTYKSLEQALTDVDFQDGVVLEEEFFFDSSDPREWVTPVFDAYLLGIREKIPVASKPSASKILYLMGELVSNGYKHAFLKQRQPIQAKAYIGAKGAVVGVKQQSHFLTKQQAALYAAAKPVQSTTRIPGGDGTATMFVDRDADGVFVDVDDKAVYLSRYFDR